jgi:hypothetical protein
MSIQEKIEAQEIAIKGQLEELRNQLNEYSKHHKANPGDWQYLTALSYANTTLTELNKQLAELKVKPNS